MRSLSYLSVLAAMLSLMVFDTTVAEDVETLLPEKINLVATPCGNNWQKWEEIGNLEGPVAHRERITALVVHDSRVGDVWVGTSHGRLLTRHDDQWILQGQIQGVQITGIAVDGDGRVWLSTSDGIRRLERDEQEHWKVRDFRNYYQGHPGFVSGRYIPGEDTVRLWGYVDGVYIPQRETAYSPFVISNEHGLFSFGGYGGIWHHFMPHYWGANSPWLDTRELVPHRRPTCMVEDGEGNLWIGTGRDGIVRLNVHARKYHSRKPTENQKDGTEFSFFTSKDVGCNFSRVVDVTASRERGVWAMLGSEAGGAHLTRFDGKTWKTMLFDSEMTAICLAETSPGKVLIGVSGRWRHQGLRQVTFEPQRIERVAGPEHAIRNIVTLPNGKVFATSWWNLYEKNASGTASTQPED